MIRTSPHTVTAEDYLNRIRYYALWAADRPEGASPRLITLSTCEYTPENGRLVVVAEEIQ